MNKTAEEKLARLREAARLRQRRHRQRQKREGQQEVKLRARKVDAPLLRWLAVMLRRGEPLPIRDLRNRWPHGVVE